MIFGESKYILINQQAIQEAITNRIPFTSLARVCGEFVKLREYPTNRQEN